MCARPCRRAAWPAERSNRRTPGCDDRATRRKLRGNAAAISRAYILHMGQPDSPPLAGYRVAVTSAHRADELCALLRRHGATVCSAPAITKVALPDDDELHRHTEALIARPPDILVVTTGIGFRGWVAAADGWGLVNPLIAALGSARIVSRGTALPARVRRAWAARRVAAARCQPGLGSVPGIRRRAARRRRRGGADPRIPMEVGTEQRIRPTGRPDRPAPSGRRQFHIRTRGGSHPAAWPRAGDGRGATGRNAHRGARDVRRAGDGSTAGPVGHSDVVAAADAVGRAGPSYRRRAAAAAIPHGTGGRASHRDPRFVCGG